MNRLPAPWGSRLDRDRVVGFRFEGRGYQALAGDTLASALQANGQRLLSRSFKYHRPRGAWSYCGLDANSYVQVGDCPSVHADELEVHDGLEATAQNVWGSLQRDYGAMAGWLARFLPVGFYYRAFFRPRGIWKYWEKLFRRTAGLGKIETATPPGEYDKQYLFADVAVIGAGPAGISAALTAADAGASVLLVDQEPQPGGSLNYARFQRQRSAVDALCGSLLQRVEAHDRIRLLTRTCCTGWFADNWLALCRGNRMYKLRAGQVILSTGSIEQPCVFRNNDLPGIIPASAAQRMVRLYAVSPGHRVSILTANQEGYDVAQDLLEAGVEIAAVVDMNESPVDAGAFEMFKGRGIRTFCGSTVTAALAARGKRAITGISVARITARECVAPDHERVDCDSLVTSIGYAPLAQLACHSGGALIYDDEIHSLRLARRPAASQICGSVNHVWTLESVLCDGERSGRRAAGAMGFKVDDGPSIELDPAAQRMNHPHPVFPHPKGKEFVDFDEDQTIADLVNAVADGFGHPELAKRYSTTGMGPSQGRTSALNALRIIQGARAEPLKSAGLTTQRPPLRAVPFGLLAGRLFEPERLTPMHGWHKAHGARFMTAGLWQRPGRYGGDDTPAEKIATEVAAVRERAGLIDVSTLGGIELRGPDAALFLNRMYTFTYLKQPVGRTRYLLMTDESGSVADDGVACRLAPDCFYITTTTTGADDVYRNMLRRNAEWGLDVELVNVTSVYAAMNIAGPEARRIIEQLNSDIDWSAASFPYLAARQGVVEGIETLAMRVGFVGEMGFELHVPWCQALTLWERLMACGRDCGIAPVGVEAQRILRLEKGHIIVGQDTDGLTMPAEAGLEWAVKQHKGYFVGGPALAQRVAMGVSRKLVGFRLLDATGVIPEECHLVMRGNEIAGRVTSVARSAALEAVVGLAYVLPEQAKVDTVFEIKVGNGQRVQAQTVSTPFYDPDNQRQKM